MTTQTIEERSQYETLLEGKGLKRNDRTLQPGYRQENITVVQHESIEGAQQALKIFLKEYLPRTSYLSVKRFRKPDLRYGFQVVYREKGSHGSFTGPRRQTMTA